MTLEAFPEHDHDDRVVKATPVASPRESRPDRSGVVAIIVLGPNSDSSETADGISSSAQAALRSVMTQTVPPDMLIVAHTAQEDPITWQLPDLMTTKLVQVHVPGAPNFGQAVSRALESVEGSGNHQWLWLLHEDVAAQPDVLECLLEVGRPSSSLGAIGPKQVLYDNPDRLLELGIQATRSGRRVNSSEPDEIDQGQYDHRDDVLAVGSAGMLVRMVAWNEVGGFDPSLGPFGDGLEYGRRLRRAGYRVAVAPRAVIRHAQNSYGHDSAGRSSFARRRGAQLYNWALATPLWKFALLMIWFPILTVMRAVVRVISRRPSMVPAEFSAYVELVRSTPGLLRQRKAIAKVATVPRSSLVPLEADPRLIVRAKRTERRILSSGAPQTRVRLDVSALATLRRHRIASGTTLSIILVAVSIISLVAWFPFINGLEGSNWGNLPSSWSLLMQQAWSGWQISGDGAVGPASPLLLPLTVVSAPFALFGVTPGQLGTLLMLLALPFAVWGGWAVAGLFTRSSATKAALAVLWGAQGTLLMSLVSGDLGSALAIVAVPALVVGVYRALGTPAYLRVQAIKDVALVSRPDRLAWAGLAGFALLAVSAASPVMVVVVAVLVGVLAMVPQSWYIRHDLDFEHEDALSRLRRAVILALITLPSLIWLMPSLVAQIARENRSQFWNWFIGQGLSNLQTESATPSWWEFLAGFPAKASMVGPALIAGNGTWPLTAWQLCAVACGLVLLLWVLVGLIGAATAPITFSASVRRAIYGSLGAVVVFWAMAVGGSYASGGWAGYAPLPMSGAAIAMVIAVAAMHSSFRISAPSLRKDPRQVRANRVRAITSAIGLTAGFTSLITVMALGGLSSSGPAGSLSTLAVQPVQAGGFPLIAREAQNSPRSARVLVLSKDGTVMQAQLLRGAGVQLADLPLGAATGGGQNQEAINAAQRHLATAVAAATSGVQAGAALLLADHAIDIVMLSSASDDAEDMANTLDAVEGLERIGTVEVGTMWRVRPDERRPSRVEIHYGDGTITEVESGPLETSEHIVVDRPATLILSETADPSWFASFNGQRLQPIDSHADEADETDENPRASGRAADEWRQMFELPVGEGELTVRYAPEYLMWWWLAASFAFMALVVLAVPWRYRSPDRYALAGSGEPRDDDLVIDEDAEAAQGAAEATYFADEGADVDVVDESSQVSERPVDQEGDDDE